MGKIRSPTSPYSPNSTSPTSPFTPRGAQLKTKSKYAGSNNSSGSQSTGSDTLSVSNSSNTASKIAVMPIDDNMIDCVMEPLAWSRLPVVDHRHCIRKRNMSLHLWSVPVYKYRKGGPRFDPYATNFWKKFGTTRDRVLNPNKIKIESTTQKEKRSKKKHAKTKDDIVLNIEFPHFKFDVVAPL